MTSRGALTAGPKRVPKAARLKTITFAWLSICLTRLADSGDIRAVNTGPKTNKEQDRLRVAQHREEDARKCLELLKRAKSGTSINQGRVQMGGPR